MGWVGTVGSFAVYGDGKVTRPIGMKMCVNGKHKVSRKGAGVRNKRAK